MRFDRAGVPDLYKPGELRIEDGFHILRHGSDLCILATGIMVHEALKVADGLKAKGLNAAVVDIFRVKPLNSAMLMPYLAQFPSLLIYEEHLLAGGFGSSILEMTSDLGLRTPTLRIGQEERFVFDNGGRSVIWKKYGLDAASVQKRVYEWIRGDLRSPRASQPAPEARL